MKRDEFNTLFPHAEQSRFRKDFGDIIFIDRGYAYDVNEPPFWNNKNFVEFLNLPPQGLKWYKELPSGRKEKFLPEWRLKYKYLREKDDFSWLNTREIVNVKGKNYDYGDRNSSLKLSSWGPKEWDVRKHNAISDIKIEDNALKNSID